MRRASEWLSATCLQYDIPVTQAQRLEICLNEVLANVLAYGGSAALVAPIRLQLEVVCTAEAGDARISHGPFPHRALMAKLTEMARSAIG